MTTITEWQHLYDTERVAIPEGLDGYTLGERIQARAGLHHLSGNARPHWSLTCDIYSRNGRDIGGGAAHDLIVGVWPELAPIAALHLADDRGEPLYAIENGLYHLGWSRFKGQDPAVNLPAFCRLWRVTNSQAHAIRGYVASDETEHYSAALEFCAKAERARWQAESDAARVLLDELAAR